VKYYQLFSILAISLSAVGCAVTSGLQTYDIPNEGAYTTDLGTQVSVIKITQQNLSSIQSIPNDFQKSYYKLFTPSQSYRLNAGDVLSIQFWAYPELSTVSSDPKTGYRIDHNGYIHLPLIGNYKSAGKTVVQINDELHKKFGSYLKNPDVIVRIISYESQPFSVQGGVKNGGQFFLTDRPTSIYTALSLAGESLKLQIMHLYSLFVVLHMILIQLN
jgi:polysaccharide export outer membrane protein